TVEAARHAVGRIADITADQHMDRIRLARWLLAPLPTFILWRRMKLWELRSYDQVLQLEQDRLIYRAGLRARFGRAWRWRAPVEDVLPLRLARHGRPITPAPVARPAVPAPHPGTPAVEPVPAVASSPVVKELAPVPAAESPVPGGHPAVPAHPSTRTQPVPTRTRGLHLDLAPMHPPIPELTAPHPVLAAASPARVEVHARIPSASEVPAELLERARALAESAPLSVKRIKRELRVGQPRAQAIIATLKEEQPAEIGGCIG
ncbi:DUF2637 domain-containing protein, partial [Streptomyces sp. NPDC005953]|uniref:DUF2637 domain-containing protein n=1 Tax=Streptomyces sp. NPDC005953 TaxID=3156719 RepID=UPI003407349C